MIKRLQNFVEKYSLFLLILILLIGIYSRVRLVLDKSFPFTYDIGRDLLVVSGMVHHLLFHLLGQQLASQVFSMDHGGTTR